MAFLCTASEGLEHAEVLLEPNLEEMLQEGVHRLKERSTWKLWTWPSEPTPHMEQKEFVEAEAFRQHLVVSLWSVVHICVNELGKVSSRIRLGTNKSQYRGMNISAIVSCVSALLGAQPLPSQVVCAAHRAPNQTMLASRTSYLTFHIHTHTYTHTTHTYTGESHQ